MIIQDQVCSIEQSKRLKELGVIQESYFYHLEVKHRIQKHIRLSRRKANGSIDDWVWTDEWTEAKQTIEHGSFKLGCTSTASFGGSIKCTADCVGMYSAFSVAELGKMLPPEIITYLEFPKEWVNYKSGEFELYLKMWKIEQDTHGWGICYESNSNVNMRLPRIESMFYADTEAQSRAMMIIHIIEKYLTPIKEINNRLIHT